MKLIDVIEKLSKGEIKDGTILTVKARNNRRYIYIENCFLDEYHFPLNIYGESDLNSDVIFIEPKPKKYYLRLDEDDSFSYINLTMYAAYEAATKDEFFGYKTKFTQEEIDESMLLKFIEQHGIKEAVDEDETN